MNSKTLYNKIKEISAGPSKKLQVRAIHDNQNNLLTSNQAIADHWKEYCENLYNYKLQSDPSVLQELQPNGNHKEKPPLMYGEVQQALHRLKNGKSPGSDGIQAKLLKIGEMAVCQALFEICSKIWDSEFWPELWTQSIIICLFKKGDRSRCENYRTISLINHSSKILLHIICQWLQLHLHRILSQEQTGFQEHRSTVKHIFTLQQLAEKHVERQNKRIAQVFIEYKKAFDHTWHATLFPSPRS